MKMSLVSLESQYTHFTQDSQNKKVVLYNKFQGLSSLDVEIFLTSNKTCPCHHMSFRHSLPEIAKLTAGFSSTCFMVRRLSTILLLLQIIVKHQLQ